MIQHFVPVSGGKDSTAAICKAIERAEKNPRFKPRFQTADTYNENPITLAHIQYLDEYVFGRLGVHIETVSAYDVPGLIDAVAFERKRESIRKNWPKELRRKRHREECEKLIGCDCPITISPPVSDERIEQAIAALVPSGNAFLDLCLIHGRFPSKKAKFCTDELKLVPLRIAKLELWAKGHTTIDWVGERAQESADRAKKPVFQRRRMDIGSDIIFRCIHGWDVKDVFAIAKRHGLRSNPLYLMGCSRVGCWPCINSRKKEIRVVGKQTPEKVDEFEDWEYRVSLVSRRDQGGEGTFATFFSADKVPGDIDDWSRASIRKVLEWTMTTRGGRQFDMLQAIEDAEAEEFGVMCDSEYGLCE